ncbi:MAG: Uma2 family endonuclease [Alphaproteobacteria bacterium]|nr:Uma2 family endonuclease [Alphaproteobacteria bacterium]
MNVVRRLMSAEEFLDWRQDKPGRWELVNGAPIQMMAGAQQKHDDIVVNLIQALGPKLKGGPCRVRTADIAVETARNIRQPDVTIDCGPRDRNALISRAPTVVFEVLSPSTRTFDQLRKVDEYKAVGTMRAVVLIDPDRPRVLLWSRASEDDAWTDVELIGLDAVLGLDAVKASLPLSDIYEDVAFEDA